MMVSEGYDEPKTPKPLEDLSEFQRNERRRANKAKAVKRKFARQAKRSRRRKRKGLVKRAVPVQAHKQLQNYLLPARPFLWLHTQDVTRARKRIADWIRAKRTSAAAAGMRRAV